MTTTEAAIVKLLVDDHIIKDPSLEKEILAYIQLARHCLSNFEEIWSEVSYVCAWLAVEHAGFFPAALLKDISVASQLKPAVFVDFLVRVRKILLDQAAGEVVVKDLDFTPSPDAPYTVPREYSAPCDACIQHEPVFPCIKVLNSNSCLTCFLGELAHCDKADSNTSEAGSPKVRPDPQQDESAVVALLTGATSTGDPDSELVPLETTNLPPAVPLTSADASNGERIFTVKKPLIDAPTVPEPSEAGTPSSLADNEDQDYSLSGTNKRTGFNEDRSEIMKAVWAEKHRLAKETGQRARDVRVPKGFALEVREKLGLGARAADKTRGRGGHKRRGRGRGGSTPSTGHDGQNQALPPQVARRSTTFPKPSSDNLVPNPAMRQDPAIAGPSTSTETTKLFSPPPSKRRRTSADSPPSAPLVPQLLAGAEGPSVSQSAAGPQRTFDPDYLRVAIRKVAESITSYHEKAPCEDGDLFWLITDLKTRLDELTGLSAQVAVDQQSANDSGLADLEELMLEKEREIVEYVRKNKCSDTKLRVMIQDLSKRLDMQQ